MDDVPVSLCTHRVYADEASLLEMACGRETGQRWGDVDGRGRDAWNGWTS